MVHEYYLKHDGAQESLDVVRRFLADLKVFEVLYDMARYL